MHFLRALVCAVAVLGLAVAAAAEERIRSFEADIFLTGEDRFSVVETIEWDFGGRSAHGIYRDIPIAYGRGHAADYHIQVELEGVTLDGGDVPVKTRESGDILNVRIGDPDRTVTGVRRYEVRYTVSRGLLYFEHHDELYWNVTGFGWKVPMEAVSATVYLPASAVSGATQTACFTGPMGSFEQHCTIQPGSTAVTFTADRDFRAGENLSLVLGLPKGIIREPTDAERFWARVRDYLSAWILIPFATLFGMHRMWKASGKDPAGKAAIDVRYEPPEGLSPAEVGTLIDEQVDMVDITSTILDLAVRGHLRIEELETTKLLFLKERDWALIKLAGTDPLRGHEAKLMGHLFALGERTTVSSLKNKFHTHLPGLRKAIYEQLSGSGSYFSAAPDQVRTRWGIGGAVLIVLAFVVLASANIVGAVAMLASGIIVLVYSRVMPRRTRRGRATYEHILGFKEFVGRVDRDRLEREGTRTPDAFEKVLPFAVVLGVADEWAEAFGDLYTEPPSWYASPRYAGGGFHPNLFVGDLGTSLDSIGSTIASTPSSSGSGGSGFGGGGGFSGGGFGGGGGGSW
ncbi:MAG: DUF2207 domain-containing protein [Myxococcota bacterium]